MEFKEKVRKFFGFGKQSRRRKTVDKIRGLRERLESKAESVETPGRRERLVAGFAGANIVVTPWLVAGQPLWAQYISCALALAAFAFLFLPVGYDGWRSATPRASLDALVRCVPFWFGLALAALFVTQDLNPAYFVEFDGANWLVIPREHIAWIPHGVRAPFEREGSPAGMNAMRTLLIFASAWLTFCALWCGVTSRRLVRVTGMAILVSVAGLSVFAVGMRAAGETHLYGKIPVTVGSVFGPFLYQNQAAAFFALAAAFAVSFSLTEWRSVAPGSPRGGLYLSAAVCAVTAGFAAVASGSFGGTVCPLLLVPVAVAAAFRVNSLRRGESASYTPVVLAGCCVALAAVFIASGDFHASMEKLRLKFSLVSQGKVDDRAPLREATLKMFLDTNPAWGYGAGSYRWVSPRYFAQMPEFCDAAGLLNSRANYAHCDWLQILAEWGIAGFALVFSVGAWIAYKLRYAFGALLPHAWPLAFGLVLWVSHACFDFLMFNPAVALMVVWSLFYLRLRCRNASRAVHRSIR